MIQPGAPVWRVSELAARVREIVENDPDLNDVTVQGEVSNLAKPLSGHIYFTLKDERAALRCVMWKGMVARLERLPRDGEAVQVHGAFTVYEARGDMQIVCDRLYLLGAGILYQQFEALKKKLTAEGLFDEARKRPLPHYPQVIGIVTSRQGAVLQDILHILRKRYPLVQVRLASTRVQGESAPTEILAALEQIQTVSGLDVVILARGGGSLEDLMPFNDERVARAIVACRVPVVCGVGHETDFTIADFAADVRAPTPTAAAQFCVPDQNELRAGLLAFQRRLAQTISTSVAEKRSELQQGERALLRNSPRAHIVQTRQRIDDLADEMGRRLSRQMALRRERLG
ncbi:MAG TPA: exodeoxyribonuclease VII large subunit, partial [Anaerolineae bacterium]